MISDFPNVINPLVRIYLYFLCPSARLSPTTLPPPFPSVSPPPLQRQWWRKQARKCGQRRPGPQKDGLPPSLSGGWHTVHSASADWPVMRSAKAKGGPKKRPPKPRPPSTLKPDRTKRGINLMRRRRGLSCRPTGPEQKQRRRSHVGISGTSEETDV